MRCRHCDLHIPRCGNFPDGNSPAQSDGPGKKGLDFLLLNMVMIRIRFLGDKHAVSACLSGGRIVNKVYVSTFSAHEIGVYMSDKESS